MSELCLTHSVAVHMPMEIPGNKRKMFRRETLISITAEFYAEFDVSAGFAALEKLLNFGVNEKNNQVAEE